MDITRSGAVDALKWTTVGTGAIGVGAGTYGLVQGIRSTTHAVASSAAGRDAGLGLQFMAEGAAANAGTAMKVAGGFLAVAAGAYAASLLIENLFD